MLSKKQKVWLWIFGAMFLIPEILFSGIASLIALLFGKELGSLYSIGINKNIFPDSSLVLILGIAVEFIGALGLFIFSFKNKKFILTFLMGVVLVILFILFAYIFSVSNMQIG